MKESDKRREIVLVSKHGEPFVWATKEGPTLAESAEYSARVQVNPDLEPTVAALPHQDWSVVVFGFASMNTRVTARTAAEAEKLAVQQFEDGEGVFDEPAWGTMDAEAELA